jgi:aquaporin TIP
MQTSMDVGLQELTAPASLRATFAEFVATLLFVFVGVGSVVVAAGGGGVVGVALAHGLAIALLVAGIGAISGGHINPAVTFAMVITGRITITRGGMYVVAQLAGAVVGMLFLRAFLIDEVVDAVGPGGHVINKEVVRESLNAVGLEAIGTFMLVWTVFAVAVTPRGNSGIIAPLFIGLAILVDHLVLIPLTGSGVNPARTFGPALVNNAWTDHWVYWVGPLLGAAVAGVTYFLLYMQDEEEA